MIINKILMLLVFSSLAGCAGTVYKNTDQAKRQAQQRDYGDRIVQRDLNEPYVPRPTDPELAALYIQHVNMVKAEEEKTKRYREGLKADKLEKRLNDIQEGKIDVSVAAKQDKSVFEVKPGTLKDNAERLVEMFGWKVYRWEADNYPIDYAYSVEVSDLKAGLDFLLKPYPVQAKRILSNRTVYFIKTNKPKK